MLVLSKSCIICDTFMNSNFFFLIDCMQACLSLQHWLKVLKVACLLEKMMPKYDLPFQRSNWYYDYFFHCKICSKLVCLRRDWFLNCILRHENYDINLSYIIYIYIYVTRRPLNDFKICLFKKRLFVVESIMAMDFAIFILLFIFFVVSCTTSNC